MGDLVLLNWYMGRDLWMDFSIASTLCNTYRKGSKANLYAAGLRTDEKLKKYVDQAERVWFKPMVVETLGGWHKSTESVLKRISEKMAEKQCESDSKKHNLWLMDLMSCAIQKMNGAMLADRFY